VKNEEKYLHIFNQNKYSLNWTKSNNSFQAFEDNICYLISLNKKDIDLIIYDSLYGGILFQKTYKNLNQLFSIEMLSKHCRFVLDNGRGSF
jgi:hypothetical protein